MIKADLQSLINTNLATASDITAVELRAVEDAFLNELFPTEINYNNLASADIIKYNLTFRKVGSTVSLSGQIYNYTLGFIGAFAPIFEIPNALFYPKLNNLHFLGGVIQGGYSGEIALFIDIGKNIALADYSILPPTNSPDQFLFINTSYQTND